LSTELQLGQIPSPGRLAIISDKERQIQESLVTKEYREALAIEHVNTTLAIQIRKLRENRGWTQNELAEHLGKHQETVSQWENPDYGRHSMTTLKELAATFDVALLVKFVSFSELAKDMVSLSKTRLSPPSFNQEKYYLTNDIIWQSSNAKDTNIIDANKTLPLLPFQEINNTQTGGAFLCASKIAEPKKEPLYA
jgi:transcriptional regulator with XRE-family HTH domain